MITYYIEKSHLFLGYNPMKNILSVLTLTILMSSAIFAQNSSMSRYLNVDSDKNIRKYTDSKLCLSCSDDNFIVDGDESFGYVELEFSDINTYG